MLDLYSRRIVGWAVSYRLKRDLAIRTLDMAIATSFVEPLRRPFESAQYCSHAYQKRLREHGFKVSMSGKRNCYGERVAPSVRAMLANAAVEAFFKTVKAELIWRHKWRTRRQAEMALIEYINGFYNPRRRHSALGGKSPIAFERKVA